MPRVGSSSQSQLALGCGSSLYLYPTNQVEIINFSTQYLSDSNLAVMFSTHIHCDRSYDKLFDQNILKNSVRLVHSNSKDSFEELLTPALLCHKDTGYFLPFAVSI